MLEVHEINLDLLIEPPIAMRATMDNDALSDLAESMRRYGVLEPLGVVPDNGKYEIIFGNRRYFAARIAALVKVPCIIREDLGDDKYGAMFDENFQRQDVTAAEEGMWFIDVIEQRGWSMPQLIKHTGKSEDYINQRAKLVREYPEVTKRVLAREMTWSQAKAIMRCKNVQWQPYLIEQACLHGATARTLSNMVDQFHAQDLAAQGKPAPHTPEHGALLMEPERKACAWCQRDDDQVNLTQLPIHSYHLKDLTEFLRATGIHSRSQASPPTDPRAA